jgi:hypothetical protein
MGVCTLCGQCAIFFTFNYKKAVRFKIILDKLNCKYYAIGPSDNWAFGLSDLRTIWLLDYRTFGLLGLWTIRLLGHQTFGFSDYWAFGLLGFQTIGLQTIRPSDYWTFGLSDLRTIGPTPFYKWVTELGIWDRNLLNFGLTLYTKRYIFWISISFRQMYIFILQLCNFEY